MEEMTRSSDNRRTRLPAGTGPDGGGGEVDVESCSVEDAALVNPSAAAAFGWNGEFCPGLAASHAARVV